MSGITISYPKNAQNTKNSITFEIQGDRKDLIKVL